MVIFGVFYFFYGILRYSTKSKFSPKVKIDDQTIELKDGMWKPARILKWSDVSSITFQSYELNFRLQDSVYKFTYDTNPENSREIKQTIRKLAERKNIEVTGG